MEYKKQAHAAYDTRYHIVISTKYRRKILRDGFGEYVKKAVIGIGKQYSEIEIIEVNTDVDHIHVLVSVPPRLAVSEAVKILKAKTGLYMRKKFLS
jgi:putative transposase